MTTRPRLKNILLNITLFIYFSPNMQKMQDNGAEILSNISGGSSQARIRLRLGCSSDEIDTRGLDLGARSGILR